MKSHGLPGSAGMNWTEEDRAANPKGWVDFQNEKDVREQPRGPRRSVVVALIAAGLLAIGAVFMVDGPPSPSALKENENGRQP